MNYEPIFYTTASERNARDYDDYDDYDVESEAYGHIGNSDPWDADYDE